MNRKIVWARRSLSEPDLYIRAPIARFPKTPYWQLSIKSTGGSVWQGWRTPRVDNPNWLKIGYLIPLEDDDE
jgi:hypothetical protein